MLFRLPLAFTFTHFAQIPFDAPPSDVAVHRPQWTELQLRHANNDYNADDYNDIEYTPRCLPLADAIVWLPDDTQILSRSSLRCLQCGWMATSCREAALSLRSNNLLIHRDPQ